MPNQNSGNNVIDFSSKLVDRKLDEYYEQEEIEFSEFEETLHYIYDDLLESLYETGMANDQDEFVRDFAYVMESIRSLVERQFNNYHNFHEVIDEKLYVSRDKYGNVTSVDWIPSLTNSEE